MSKISNYNVIDLYEIDDEGNLNITPREALEKMDKAIFVLRFISIIDDNPISASIDIVSSVNLSGERYELSTFGQSVYIAEDIDTKFHVD